MVTPSLDHQIAAVQRALILDEWFGPEEPAPPATTVPATPKKVRLRA